ncbi:uncharacterized protein LOC129795678 [Lutzomyia longipalpis]|uniref:uncharacterized protein LOC129795678 n=1 Tax=Lutzomyia longipalpis TaxID=7200 RepID=UPI0024833B27|nr:uncharacterized protein LOC129795678 [Lutzomyia longipalpis]
MDHPITTPPRRREFSEMSGMLLHNSESCKTTPGITRKLEPHHRALLESGSQSAKSSPLPHRRLDKLEGVIRDKPTGLCARRFDDELNSSADSSPAVGRKFSGGCTGMRHQETPTLGRRQLEAEGGGSPMARRRVDSDPSRRMGGRCPNDGDMSRSDDCTGVRRRDVFSSPMKGILGEPGVFSSPIHNRKSAGDTAAIFGGGVVPKAGMVDEQLQTRSSRTEDDDGGEMPCQPDQTIVSGWLKFRDNKRWKIRWGVVTKLSPAAGKPQQYQ